MDSKITDQNKNNKNFIAEFEGLRGVLAAWVVFGHILLISGYTYHDGWFGILFSPVLGVYTFMMLSGFVITAALDRRQSSWLEFMTRRLFRLFPVYLLCLALSIVLLEMTMFISRSTTLSTFGPENVCRLDDISQNFAIYLLADLTLLQCLLPNQWFPFATETFLPPTWSLTLEWLFYIAAPLLIWSFRKSMSRACISIACLLILLWIFDARLAAWNPSFNFRNACHFLTGIASYYIWKNIPARNYSIGIKFGFWALLGVLFVVLDFPYKIWFAVMTMVIYTRIHRGSFFFIEWPRRILLLRSTQFLGRISYVTYLLHWIVIEVVIFWMIQFFPEITDKFTLAIACTLLVFPLTYVTSDILHRYIELPMTKIPKRWKFDQLRQSAIHL